MMLHAAVVPQINESESNISHRTTTNDQWSATNISKSQVAVMFVLKWTQFLHGDFRLVNAADTGLPPFFLLPAFERKAGSFCGMTLGHH